MQLQAKHYKISTKGLPPLSKGEIVATDISSRWFNARVEQQGDARSYKVETEDGTIFRRKRRLLRSAKQ